MNPEDVYDLVVNVPSGLIDVLERLVTSNNRQVVGITLESTIYQNQFILNLWQTFVTIHFAIVGGFFYYRKPINIQVSILFVIAYIFGISINYISLIDAYRELDALYADMLRVLAADQTLRLEKTMLYFKADQGISDSRLLIVRIIFILTSLSVFTALIKHTKYHKTKQALKQQYQK